MLDHFKEKIEKLYPWIAAIAVLGIFLSLVFRYLAPDLVTPVLLLVLVLGGIPILAGQLVNVLKLNFSSDILAAISIVTAIFLNENLAACLVVLMLSGGETLERYASGRASKALTAFVKRLPSKVKKIENDGVVEKDVSEIVVGDILSFDPHQIAPFDGIVEQGHGSVDESLLTGEPYKVSKVVGSAIVSGSVNGEVALTFKVTTIGKDTRYQKILKVMQEAQGKKLKLRRLGDQLGAWYTPLAVCLAIIFAYVENSATTFLSVIVVATPCPLIIAIPVAIIGAISRAAERGILIRDPALLESISKIDTVFFDKTGTMTYGEPDLNELILLDETKDKDLILGYVGSLEQFSSHPLAKPILKYAREKNITLSIPDSCQEKAGMGLIGEFGDLSVVVTSRKKAIQNFGVINLPEKKIGLEVIVLVNSKAALLISLTDKVKKGGKELIEHLKAKHGVSSISILSGDTEEEVRNLANEVGITEIRAKLSPEEKYEIVKKETLVRQTLFVGDGINDAPALSAASIGIAFGTGSEISSEAASAVILDGKLEKLDELLHIAKFTRKVALQSAVGGMVLSILGMFLAGFGVLNPVTGALTQEVIDVFAVLNSLRTCLNNKS
jgi:heavy metal translocating P-type ATPase